MDAIAIDGPAASGKSAIGVALAHQLGYRFLDTGAMYRAVAWAAIARGVDPADGLAVASLVGSIDIEINDPSRSSAEATGVLIDGVDVTAHLRDPAVDAAVSLVSRVPAVRRALVQIQQNIAREGRVVMAGRDIGSVVLPHARLKVYLDASVEVRARRRYEQMRSMGIEPDMERLIADLVLRDGIDSSREASPLTAAPGAVIIHTDNLTIEEVVRRLANLAQQ